MGKLCGIKLKRAPPRTMRFSGGACFSVKFQDMVDRLFQDILDTLRGRASWEGRQPEAPFPLSQDGFRKGGNPSRAADFWPAKRTLDGLSLFHRIELEGKGAGASRLARWRSMRQRLIRAGARLLCQLQQRSSRKGFAGNTTFFRVRKSISRSGTLQK